VGETEYVRVFSPGNQMRVYIVAEKGQVVDFVVQYEAEIRGQLRPIRRYDMAHGFVHVDIYHGDKPREKRRINLSPKDAVNWAIDDLEINWSRYRQGYEQEMENK